MSSCAIIIHNTKVYMSVPEKNHMYEKNILITGVHL